MISSWIVTALIHHVPLYFSTLKEMILMFHVYCNKLKNIPKVLTCTNSKSLSDFLLLLPHLNLVIVDLIGRGDNFVNGETEIYWM